MIVDDTKLAPYVNSVCVGRDWPEKKTALEKSRISEHLVVTTSDYGENVHFHFLSPIKRRFRIKSDDLRRISPTQLVNDFRRILGEEYKTLPINLSSQAIEALKEEDEAGADEVAHEYHQQKKILSLGKKPE